MTGGGVPHHYLSLLTLHLAWWLLPGIVVKEQIGFISIDLSSLLPITVLSYSLLLIILRLFFNPFGLFKEKNKFIIATLLLPILVFTNLCRILKKR